MTTSAAAGSATLPKEPATKAAMSSFFILASSKVGVRRLYCRVAGATVRRFA
jgi:hypothetical protein